MDSDAYEILKEYTNAGEAGERPHVSADMLLDIFRVYMWQDEQRTRVNFAPANPSWKNWDNVTALEAIAAIRTLTEDLTRAYGWLTTDARKAGASWTEIGNALGISKQGAWERYRDYANRSPWTGVREEELTVLLGEQPPEETIDRTQATAGQTDDQAV